MPRKIEIPVPIVVERGDVYVWQDDIHCRDGSIMKAGSLVRVIHATQSTPYDEIGPNDCNWVCEADNGTTIWATLEACIARGLLVKLEGV